MREAGGTGRTIVVMHVYADTSAVWLADGLVDAVIDQKARPVGERAVIRLLSSAASYTTLPPFKRFMLRVIPRENVPARSVSP